MNNLGVGPCPPLLSVLPILSDRVSLSFAGAAVLVVILNAPLPVRPLPLPTPPLPLTACPARQFPDCLDHVGLPRARRNKVKFSLIVSPINRVKFR